MGIACAGCVMCYISNFLWLALFSIASTAYNYLFTTSYGWIAMLMIGSAGYLAVRRWNSKVKTE